MMLVESKVLTVLEEQEFKDNYGNRVEFESEALRCKVTSEISRPDTVFHGNEVGAGLDVTGDVHTGGENFLCEKGCIAQIISNKKSETFYSYWDYKPT